MFRAAGPPAPARRAGRLLRRAPAAYHRRGHTVMSSSAVPRGDGRGWVAHPHPRAGHPLLPCPVPERVPTISRLAVATKAPRRPAGACGRASRHQQQDRQEQRPGDVRVVGEHEAGRPPRRHRGGGDARGVRGGRRGAAPPGARPAGRSARAPPARTAAGSRSGRCRGPRRSSTCTSMVVATTTTATSCCRSRRSTASQTTARSTAQVRRPGGLRPARAEGVGVQHRRV